MLCHGVQQKLSWAVHGTSNTYRPQGSWNGMSTEADEVHMQVQERLQTELERLQTELELLQAMYPDSLAFDNTSRELRYSPAPTSDAPAPSLAKGVLALRLPDYYPNKDLPELVTATDAKGLDARTRVSHAFSTLGTVEGEETLDALILAFRDLVNESVRDVAPAQVMDDAEPRQAPQTRKTVAIWLHHLLNTNKRKLALNPSLDAQSIAGLAKPGYPGIMVFSGPKPAVDGHVAELRSQRWQAFQVRYDSEEVSKGSVEAAEELVWDFQLGFGIHEVESLSEMAQAVVRTEHRDTFLQVMGVK